MQDLASLLHKKYKSHFRYIRAVEIIHKHWSSLVNELDRFLVPKNIYKNELVIECNNPVWMSEIDCFKDEIIQKVNHLLKQHCVNLTVSGIKPFVNANLVITEKKTPTEMIPTTVSERIEWSIKKKKAHGAVLCHKCQKIWDQCDPCRLCQLTGE